MLKLTIYNDDKRVTINNTDVSAAQSTITEGMCKNDRGINHLSYDICTHMRA